jgi:putative DNA primase/helicase
MANASYNPDAACPRWVESFHTTFENDDDLKTFVRRIIGYSLTGLVREQYLFVCHGQGADGKDFFLETIASILGSYALTPDFSMFLTSKNKNDSRYLEAMGELKGIRFAVSVEPSKGVRFDNGTIKKLTGNNKLKGSVLGTKAYYFYPTHKILLVCNHLPHIDDLSRGMKRRIRIIPFPHAFDWTKNTNLREVFLTEERDGIFRWCVDCAHEYLQYGLPVKMPKVVESATKDYFEANDTVGQFIKEWIVEDINKYVLKQDAYNRFVEINGQNAMSKRDFIDSIENRQDSPFTKNERQKKGACWNGFTITSYAPPAVRV